MVTNIASPTGPYLLVKLTVRKDPVIEIPCRTCGARFPHQFVGAAPKNIGSTRYLMVSLAPDKLTVDCPSCCTASRSGTERA